MFILKQQRGNIITNVLKFIWRWNSKLEYLKTYFRKSCPNGSWTTLITLIVVTDLSSIPLLGIWQFLVSCFLFLISRSSLLFAWVLLEHALVILPMANITSQVSLMSFLPLCTLQSLSLAHLFLNDFIHSQSFNLY